MRCRCASSFEVGLEEDVSKLVPLVILSPTSSTHVTAHLLMILQVGVVKLRGCAVQSQYPNTVQPAPPVPPTPHVCHVPCRAYDADKGFESERLPHSHAHVKGISTELRGFLIFSRFFVMLTKRGRGRVEKGQSGGHGRSRPGGSTSESTCPRE